MNSLQVSYLKLADHKNGKRLWLQGLRLEDAGYIIGARYSPDYDTDANQVVLTLSENGEKKVSRKKIGDDYYPLIDITNASLAQFFQDVERVQVVINVGSITIEYHHLDFKRIERENRLRETIQSGKALSMGSMAHGAGILDYYLHKGFQDEDIPTGLVWAVEPENAYLQTSWRNNPSWSYDCKLIEGRIEDVDEKSLQAPIILAAGLPCTGASIAGRSKNKLKFAEAHETAGTAFIGFLMAIKELSPPVIVFENVVQYENTISMHMIQQTLSDWRYKVHTTIVDRELGAFEDRKRLCMVAVSEGIDFEFDLKPVREREQRLGEMLDDIPADSDLWNACAYLDVKNLRDKAAGKGFTTQLVDEYSGKIGTVGRSYNKWRSTEPMVANHPADPKLRRLLTVNELSKVKTIDKSLVEGMSRTKQMEMMGQSVLGVAFQAVGRNIAQCLKTQYIDSAIVAA